MWKKLIRWSLFLLVAGGALAGGGAWYVWVRGDHYARTAIARRLSEMAPTCRITMEDVDFDWEQTVVIEGLTFRSADHLGKGADATPILVVPEMAIVIDRALFLSERKVEIESIRLSNPRFHFVRLADGHWNVQELLPLHLNPDLTPPTCEISNATLRFELAQPTAKTEPVGLTLEHADFQLTPTGGGQLAIAGRSRVASAGALAATGTLDLATGAWSLEGSVEQLEASGNVGGFLWNISAAFRDRVTNLQQRLQAARAVWAHEAGPAIVLGEPLPSRQGVPVRTASHRTDSSPPRHEAPPPAATAPVEASKRPSVWAGILARLGIEARVDVEFSVDDPGSSKQPTYNLHVKIRDGALTNPLLPFPLADLAGRLDWNRESLVLHSLSARHGKTVLTCQGEYRFAAAKPEGAFTIRVDNLVLGASELESLPEEVAACLRMLRPHGLVNVTGRIERTADGRWAPRSVNANVSDMRVRPEPFPYPASDINGTIRQTAPGRWNVDLGGMAGGRPVDCHGFITSAAAGGALEMTLTGKALPIDEALREACDPKLQEVLEQFDPHGLADGRLRLWREAGRDMPIEWAFHAEISQGSLNYAKFPYRLTNLSGEVAFNSVNEMFTFRNMTARHGEAHITGEGHYQIAPPGEGRRGRSADPTLRSPLPGVEMSLGGKNVRLDDALHDALPPAVQQAWDDLRPKGIADFQAELLWVPGYQPDIELTHVSVRHGGLNPRAFPYSLESILVEARFVPWRQTPDGEAAPAEILIDEFVGWHDGIRTHADGSRMTLGTDGQWRLHLPNLRVSAFHVDSDFLQAAPAGIRQAVKTLQPRGRFEVTGTVTYSGQGPARELPDVSWDLTTQTSPKTHAAITLGTEVTNLSGMVKTVGRRRDGAIQMTGHADFDQATILGQTVRDIRGRFSVHDNVVVIGSLKALPRADDPNPEPVPPEKQFRGDLFGGLVTLSARIQTGDDFRFQAYVTLSGGSLERYVTSSLGDGPGELAGVMNGFVSFWGTEPTQAAIRGRGELNIVPAALYRLPAIMQIFQAFSFAPPNGPAFSAAQFLFTIHHSAFHFQPTEGGSIVLSGDTLRLVGGGRVGFNHVLDLEFYSTLPNNPAGPLQRVPILGDVVGGIVKAATTGWVKVLVTGRAKNPRVNLVPLPVLPDTWRNIIRTLGPRVPARPIGFRSRR